MAANLVFTLTGGATNAIPGNSLGGDGSTIQLSGIPLNNLFDDASYDEAVTGDVEYRAIDIFNIGDAEAVNVKFFFGAQTTSPESSIQAGLDSTTQSIPNETTVPSGVTFTEPTVSAPIDVADIAINDRQRIWIRRTIDSGAENISDDTATLSVTYA